MICHYYYRIIIIVLVFQCFNIEIDIYIAINTKIAMKLLSNRFAGVTNAPVSHCVYVSIYTHWHLYLSDVSILSSVTADEQRMSKWATCFPISLYIFKNSNKKTLVQFMINIIFKFSFF